MLHSLKLSIEWNVQLVRIEIRQQIFCLRWYILREEILAENRFRTRCPPSLDLNVEDFEGPQSVWLRHTPRDFD